MGEKGERTKDQICKEAFQLFAQRGYTAVSMQDICTKCGLSKGGLYRHYESRKQLFMDLLERAQNNEDDREALFYQMSVPTPVILDAFLEHIRLELNPQLPRINLAIYEFCSAYKEEIGGDFWRRSIAAAGNCCCGFFSMAWSGGNAGWETRREPRTAFCF